MACKLYIFSHVILDTSLNSRSIKEKWHNDTTHKNSEPCSPHYLRARELPPQPLRALNSVAATVVPQCFPRARHLPGRRRALLPAGNPCLRWHQSRVATQWFFGGSVWQHNGACGFQENYIQQHEIELIIIDEFGMLPPTDVAMVTTRIVTFLGSESPTKPWLATFWRVGE